MQKQLHNLVVGIAIAIISVATVTSGHAIGPDWYVVAWVWRDLATMKRCTQCGKNLSVMNQLGQKVMQSKSGGGTHDTWF
eukprot:4948310-Amphidinium_carterae.1